jgi:hypothetical protein
MSIEPSVEEQQLLEDTHHRRTSPLTGRERLWAALSASGLLIAVAALWAIDPPRSFAIVPALVCTVILALAANVYFDTPLGFAPTSQLAFIPLAFALPPALVPPAAAIAIAVGQLPEVIRGRVRLSRLVLQPSNAWFSVGPAAVLAVSSVPAWHAAPGLLVAALAASSRSTSPCRCWPWPSPAGSAWPCSSGRPGSMGSTPPSRRRPSWPPRASIAQPWPRSRWYPCSG